MSEKDNWLRFELPKESDPPKVSSTPKPTPDPSFRIAGWADPVPTLKQPDTSIPPPVRDVSDNLKSVGQQQPARSRLPCRLTIRLPTELIAAIDERCEAMDQGASQLIR